MAKSERGGGKGTNSGGSRTSRATNVPGRGPGKNYRIVNEYEALKELRGMGFVIGGTTDSSGKPAWIGYKDPRFTPATEGRKYPGGTNRSRPTRTPRSVAGQDSARYVLPDRPDGTWRSARAQELGVGPWPFGNSPGTPVVYRSSRFSAEAAAKKSTGGMKKSGSSKSGSRSRKAK